MAGQKNEPSCWTCRFAKMNPNMACGHHQFVFPENREAYLICRDWKAIAPSEREIRYMRQQMHDAEECLYVYDLYSNDPPRVVARISDLQAGLISKI